MNHAVYKKLERLLDEVGKTSDLQYARVVSRQDVQRLAKNCQKLSDVCRVLLQHLEEVHNAFERRFDPP